MPDFKRARQKLKLFNVLNTKIKACVAIFFVVNSKSFLTNKLSYWINEIFNTLGPVYWIPSSFSARILDYQKFKLISLISLIN